MAGHRAARVAEDIRRELAAIFRELKDPRVKTGLLSIVKVDAAHDLSSCKVYVSSLEGIMVATTAAAGLKSAAGYIKKELGERLKLRHIPELAFVATDSIEYATNISKMLSGLVGHS